MVIVPERWTVPEVVSGLMQVLVKEDQVGLVPLGVQ